MKYNLDLMVLQDEATRQRKALGDTPLPAHIKGHHDNDFEPPRFKRPEQRSRQGPAHVQGHHDSSFEPRGFSRESGRGQGPGPAHVQGHHYDNFQTHNKVDPDWREDQWKKNITRWEENQPQAARGEGVYPTHNDLDKPFRGERGRDGRRDESPFPTPRNPAIIKSPDKGPRRENYHDKLKEERKQDYNDFLQRKSYEEASKRPRRGISASTYADTETDSGIVSRLASREGQQSRLRAERHREYNQLLEKKQREDDERYARRKQAEYRDPRDKNTDFLTPLTSRDGQADKLKSERSREYNELLDRKRQAEQSRRNVNFGEQARGEGLFSRLGSRESVEKDKLREERHKEYNNYLKVKKQKPKLSAHGHD